LLLELEIRLSIIYVEGTDMTFFESVGKCYRKYFIFKGRASKSEFWWFYLLAFLFAWPLLLAETDTRSWASILSLIYFLLTISVAFPLAAVWTRRMHDVDKSAWVAFFFLIPIVGTLLLLRWATKDGTPGPNKYGEPDNSPLPDSLKARTEN